MTDVQQFEMTPDTFLSSGPIAAPEIHEDRLPHYGMALLRQMNIDKLDPNQFIGDFNPKTERGVNQFNITFFPAFTLMVFTGGVANIPFERQPTYVDEPPTENLGRAFFDGRPETNLRSSEFVSPGECARRAVRFFRDQGFVSFPSLIGYMPNDPQAEIKTVRALVEVFLPFRNPKELPVTTRIRGGVSFSGPFLDEITAYVKTEGLSRFNRMQMEPKVRLMGEAFYKELLAGLIAARTTADRSLNESEAEMRNPNGVKRGYDLPDLENANADVPVDLYLLAHTNRTEIENKPAEASAEIGKQIVSTLRETLIGTAAGATEPMITQAEADLQAQEHLDVIAAQAKRIEALEEAARAASVPPSVSEEPPKTKAKK